MRKFIRQLSYIPKHQKISEKTMLTRIATTITIVLICLVSMSVTAYAHFSCNIASSLNTIKAATFEASIEINDSNGNSVTVDTTNPGIGSAELKGGEAYKITLKHSPSSTAKTGFVIITAENCNSRYHTQQLGKDGSGNTETISFSVEVNADTVISFSSNWGTSCYYDLYKKSGDKEPLYITQGEDIKISIDNIEETKPIENSNTSSEVHTERLEQVTSSNLSSTDSSYTESAVSSEIQTTNESATQEIQEVTETTSDTSAESSVATNTPTTEGIEQ